MELCADVVTCNHMYFCLLYTSCSACINKVELLSCFYILPKMEASETSEHVEPKKESRFYGEWSLHQLQLKFIITLCCSHLFFFAVQKHYFLVRWPASAYWSALAMAYHWQRRRTKRHSIRFVLFTTWGEPTSNCIKFVLFLSLLVGFDDAQRSAKYATAWNGRPAGDSSARLGITLRVLGSRCYFRSDLVG